MLLMQGVSVQLIYLVLLQFKWLENIQRSGTRPVVPSWIHEVQHVPENNLVDETP